MIAPRTDASGVAAPASRIGRSVADPRRIHGHQVRACGSVGTYLATAGDRADDVLHAAEQARYANKRGRRHTVPD